MYEGEICTAEEYNKKYCSKLGKDSAVKRKKHVRLINDMDRFWDSMTEKEKKDWAESYMEFFVYYEIHGNKK